MPLFADKGGEFLGGMLAAAIPIIGALVGWYLLIRKARRTETVEDRNLTEKQRTALVKERRQDERTALDELRDLYNEVKDRLIRAEDREINCQRRLARVEAALFAAKIPLPEMPEENGGEPEKGAGQS